MHAETSIQKVVWIVLVFSLLWTIGILVPDQDYESIGVASNEGARSTKLGLAVNGTHYIIVDANIGLYEDPNDGRVHNVAYASQVDSRVSSNRELYTYCLTA